MNYTIQHMGYTFDSIHPPSHYLKQRSKRLRKKLEIGEFLSLGYKIEMKFDDIDSEIIDVMIDETFNNPILDEITIISYWDSTSAIVMTEIGNNNEINELYDFLNYFFEKVLSTYATNYNLEIILFHNV